MAQIIDCPQQQQVVFSVGFTKLFESLHADGIMALSSMDNYYLVTIPAFLAIENGG